MNGRLEGFHAEKDIGKGAGEGQADIGRQQRFGDVEGPGQHLAKRVEPFGLKELHPTGAHDRQEDQGDNDDPEPAQPLQDPAPEQRSLGHLVEADEHGRAGRGHPRDGLEIGIRERGPRRADHEGQGADQRQHDPGGCGQQKGVLDGHPFDPRIGRRDHDQPAEADGENGDFTEDSPTLASRCEIKQGAWHHRDAHGDDEKRDDPGDWTQFHGFSQTSLARPEGCLCDRAPVPQDAHCPCARSAGVKAAAQTCFGSRVLDFHRDHVPAPHRKVKTGSG